MSFVVLLESSTDRTPVIICDCMSLRCQGIFWYIVVAE